MLRCEPSEEREEAVGDIFEAVMALFLIAENDARRMRQLLGVKEECSKHLYDLLSGFAQKMHFFRHCSGLTLSSILQFLLPMVPSIHFEKLGFDIHDPFASAGFRVVSHPEITTFRKRKKDGRNCGFDILFE